MPSRTLRTQQLRPALFARSAAAFYPYEGNYNRFITLPGNFACDLSMCDDDDEVECLSEWRCISTRCCLTLGLLTDPARGEHCAHDAKCNYAALRALVGSVGRSKARRG